MAEKPEARGAPKKTGDPEKQKAQSARFIEAARNAGIDDSGEAFDSAMKTITQKRQAPRD